MERTVHICSICEESDVRLQQPFGNCSRCNSQTYCSLECQSGDWSDHKKVCGKSILDSMSASNRDFCKSLLPDSFLHELPENDVYDMLDDCFFLRIADCFCFGKDKKCKGGNMNKFRDFLDLAEERVGFLPPWWCESKRGECERTAKKTERMAPGSKDYNTRDFLLDHALISAYGDYNIPMKLRLLAEKVYGTKVVSSW